MRAKFITSLILLLSLWCFGARAQERALPSQMYFAACAQFNDGEFADALKNFDSEWRGSFKIATNRWVDSICYATMLGETYYQLGRYPEALENYDAALRLALQYADWMRSIKIVPQASGSIVMRDVPWGDANPTRRMGRVPDKVSIQFGDVNYTEAYRSGGVAMPASLKQIRADEIVRCTALAIRRRGELLGPLAAKDALNTQMLTKLQVVWQAMAGSWMQAWLDIEIGLAYAVGGKDDQANQHLMRGAWINGAAHPLTSTVYLAMGNQFLRKGDYQKAYGSYLEAATLAYYYEDLSTMEEAFRGLGTTVQQLNPQTVSPVLVAAEMWSKREKLVFLRNTILTLLAEDYLRMKQPTQCLACLKEAEMMAVRRSYALGTAGARLHYIRAKAGFLDPTPAAQNLAAASLGTAMRFMQTGGLWNFQIAQVNLRRWNGLITSREASEFYTTLLREPTANDWALSPMETLAYTMAPHPESWETWFLSAVDLEKSELAFEISERARRANFLQSLHFGGRLHMLRLLLECPEKDLNIAQVQRRKDILIEYPGYALRAKQIQELQIKLRKMSFPITDKEDSEAAFQAVEQIQKLAAEQELILISMVLDRRPVDVTFPKVRTLKEVQAGLKNGEGMLVFFAARGQMFMFLMNNEQFVSWGIFDTGTGKGSTKKAKNNNLTDLQLAFGSMLREIGLGTGAPVKPSVMEDFQWKTTSQQVLSLLTKNANAQVDFADSDLTSLVIVPDRFAWYLPFEMLQIQTPKGVRPTISKYAIRYAPMASLGVPWKARTEPTSPYTMVVTGKNVPEEAVLQRLNDVLPRPVEFDQKSFGGLKPVDSVTSSAVLGTIFDKMLVFEDLKNDQTQGYAATPMALDKATLGHWFSLPYGGPRLVVLTGFRSQGEDLAKKPSRTSKKVVPAVPGQEMFLASMGFLANGTDTVVLSRWPVGGASAYSLISNFLERLPEESSTARAWRKAVLKQAGNTFQVAQEPRVASNESVETVRGTFPLFWASYILIDSGTSGMKDLDETSEPESDPNDVPAIVVPAEEEEEGEEE